MKQKLTARILSKENPPHIFSKEANFPPNLNNYFNFPLSKNFRIINNKNQKNNQTKNSDKKSSVFSSVISSLKSMTLNSQLYGNYIDFYTTSTAPKKPFKIPSVDKSPNIPSKVFYPIRLQPLTTKEYNKEKISISPLSLIHI